MLNIKKHLPIALVVSNVLVFSVVGAAKAQEPMKQVVQEQLRACIKQEDYSVKQLMELKRLRGQTNLTQQQKFEQYLAILTSAQREQLKSCTQEQVMNSTAGS